ncbi:hypothetical protein D3C76_978290 [compost metagenome]
MSDSEKGSSDHRLQHENEPVHYGGSPGDEGDHGDIGAQRHPEEEQQQYQGCEYP